jgi:hypothetical protein
MAIFDYAKETMFATKFVSGMKRCKLKLRTDRRMFAEKIHTINTNIKYY